jgi:hypothetical protein
VWNGKAKVIREIVGQLVLSQNHSDKHEQHTVNARNQTTTKTAIMDTAHISECANVRVQNVFHVLQNIIGNTTCKLITAAKLCIVETLLFPLCNCKYHA